MSLEVLVSTMNQTNYDLIYKMKLKSNAVIVNQHDFERSQALEEFGFRLKWIDTRDRGLSLSRNLAIKNSTASFCVLADDDLEYIDNYENIILKQFELNPSADIIIFQVEGIETEFKKYSLKSKRLGYITSMRVSSVEIAFRRKSIVDNDIEFNELFGSGSKYSSGEENIFLFDCLNKKLKVFYVPVKIADLHIGESSWFKGYTVDYFVSRGAMFSAMSYYLSVPLILQFAIRKRNIYLNEISIFDAIKYMFKGRKEYISK